MIKQYFKKLRKQAQKQYESQILNMISINKPNIKLLDLGCADGSWTSKLKKQLILPKIYGLDYVDSNIKKAKKKGIIVEKGDLNKKLPYKNNFFDIVHSNQVIEHLYNTSLFLSEIYRVLKPGGYVIISTENLSSWHNIFALILGWQPFSLANISDKNFQIGNPISIHYKEKVKSPKTYQHVKVFSYLGLKEIIEEAGFKIEKYVGAGYYPLPNWFSNIDVRHSAFLTVKARKIRKI